MKIVKWAAVLVTALFALMNLGAVQQSSADTWLRIVGALMAAAGAAAAVGLAANLAWGRAAVIGVGSVNVAVAVISLITGAEGAAIGLVVGGLGVALGLLTPARETRPVEA
jgi:hypothetical protein